MTNLAENETANAITVNTATEADNILAAVREDTAGHEKYLKFKKGEYVIGDDSVELGTEFLAHTVAWTKTWIKFIDKKVADRKLYRVSRGERPPERQELDDLDKIDSDDDPWSFQYLLPLENIATGELVIFVTSTVGGQQAVREVCNAYAKRTIKGEHGQPIIKLATMEMATKKYGSVPRPLFEVIGWDTATEIAIPEESLAAAIPTQPAAAKRDDMDDEIPF